ncbi:DUF3892 domain-containing protein [Paraburkholderia atlantica]
MLSEVARHADVFVWQTPQGHKYLRTGHDMTIADNLLGLPECPINGCR